MPSGVNQFEFDGLLPETEYDVVMWPVSGQQRGENTSTTVTTSMFIQFLNMLPTVTISK